MLWKLYPRDLVVSLLDQFTFTKEELDRSRAEQAEHCLEEARQASEGKPNASQSGLPTWQVLALRHGLSKDDKDRLVREKMTANGITDRATALENVRRDLATPHEQEKFRKHQKELMRDFRSRK